MTIIILTIIAIIALALGLIAFFTTADGPTQELAYQKMIAHKCEAMGWILFGIFFLLLALLFKLNPFW